MKFQLPGEPQLEPTHDTDALGKVPRTVRLVRAGHDDIISRQPDEMPFRLIDPKTFEQKVNFHTAGMDVPGLPGLFKILDAEQLRPGKLCLPGERRRSTGLCGRTAAISTGASSARGQIRKMCTRLGNKQVQRNREFVSKVPGR